MFLYIIATLAVIVIYLCDNWIKKRYSHWSSKGIEGPTPVPFVGNFGSFITLKHHIRVLVKRWYTDFPNANVVGVYQGFQPTLLVRDPKLIKQVLVKDFEIFHERGLNNSEKAVYENLLVLSGEKWKMVRQNLTPLFTTSKFNKMIPSLDKCIDRFLNHVDLLDHDKAYEFQNLWQRFTLDATCCCIIGINIDMYSENKNSFLSFSKKEIGAFSKFWWTVQFIDSIIPDTRRKVEAIEKYLNKGSFNLTNYFLNLVSLLKMEDEINQRNGLMHVMFELQKQNEKKKSQFQITDEVIAAHFFLFTGAGLENSTAITFVLYELARHHDIQDRVYKEICEVMEKHGGKITYDALNEMTYLHMIYNETMRLHPVVGTIIRIAKYDHELSEAKVKIEKGTRLVISVDGLHMDPKYYENPEDFVPERFLPNNKTKKNVPEFAYLPFGDGPRKCIALRFVKINVLFGLAAFLKRFKVDVSDKSPKKFKANPRSVRYICDEGVWVKISKRVEKMS